MPLITANAVFLMIPRTASTWARQAMRNAGVEYWESNPKHATEVIQRVEKPHHVPQFCFTFVREPAAWLRSRWFLGPWEDELSSLWHVDFEQFRAAVSDSMIEMYFKKYTSRCKFVGRTETIADDLVTVLRQVGEDFDELSLRETKPVNESPKDGMPIGEYFWKLKRDQLGQLPDDMLVNLPPQLLPKLPQGTLNRLPPDKLIPLIERMNLAALQAGGAATRQASA